MHGEVMQILAPIANMLLLVCLRLECGSIQKGLARILSISTIKETWMLTLIHFIYYIDFF